MAWRIDEHVVRGEIDNRTRGRVTGRIWFAGLERPVELDLEGNAWRDLAGRRLVFVNPEPKPGLDARLAPRQEGVVGDITASRKVKVPDIPLDQIGEYYAARKPFPWHWGNSLYLEWHSATNGRVVIESATYQLTVEPDHAWDLSEAEEDAQKEANGAALLRFMQRLTADLENVAAENAATEETAPESADVAWTNEVDTEAGIDADENRPLTEAEADAMLEESDRLADRVARRLDQAGSDADFDQILEEELERRARERGERPLTPEEEEQNARRIEEWNRAAEEADDDPEVDEIIDRKHPLAARAFALTVRLAKEPKARGWINDETHEEHPVVELAFGTTCAAAKLAGSLNGREWPPSVMFCASAIARLKRGRSYLGDALAAADDCARDQLTDPTWLAAVRAELDAITTEVDVIITDLRARLERGFD